MNSTIKINGLKFEIQGDGFVRAEGDFDQIVALIDARLSDLSPHDISRLHFGAIFTDDGANNKAAFDELNAIATAAAGEVMKEWHDPSGAFVTISSGL